jgi:hypothetical protein
MLWTSRRRKSLKFQAGGSWAELKRSGAVPNPREVVSEPERDSRRVRRGQGFIMEHISKNSKNDPDA